MAFLAPSRVGASRPCRRALFSAPSKPRATSLVQRNSVADKHHASPELIAGLLARFDGDGDGRLTLAECQQAIAALQALDIPPAATTTAALHSAVTSSSAPQATTSKPSVPNTWELQLFNGLKAARERGQSPMTAVMDYVRGKMNNSGKARVSASDVVWSFCGMFASVAALGIINLHVRTWPLVGVWHQQGVGLLLGSFGTLCVLIFGRPDAEAVRIWNLLAGHVVATFTVLALLHVLGPSVWSRALAMAAMIAAMLLTDSVHPPGGALVLMAVDSAAIQRMDWWFMLYPSLTFTLGVLLPIGATVNWLKRNVKFDWPAAPATPPASAPSTPSRPPPPSPPFTPPELRPKMA
ncbi:hypothetical protein HYH03_007813 [Edaphochlamys debaryana]|uniref:EF-hand domain-containing protein n=1 Tax=Edaphochlamys debaryana TaxID=47281 RepID=A0A835Y156_9CHLO|nr:hypothetical protein HYH03_007813 [Edaphochlamys debaryana]|eukprot:KAG2493875.1 hypothetical protein HYH03_007813 [Edaphochlamys debaryana]